MFSCPSVTDTHTQTQRKCVYFSAFALQNNRSITQYLYLYLFSVLNIYSFLSDGVMTLTLLRSVKAETFELFQIYRHFITEE